VRIPGSRSTRSLATNLDRLRLPTNWAISLIANPQPSAEPIYLVTDAGSPVAAFTTRHEMQTYLKRRHGTLNNPVSWRSTRSFSNWRECFSRVLLTHSPAGEPCGRPMVHVHRNHSAHFAGLRVLGQSRNASIMTMSTAFAGPGEAARLSAPQTPGLVRSAVR
jgi:hypothetical protein